MRLKLRSGNGRSTSFTTTTWLGPCSPSSLSPLERGGHSEWIVHTHRHKLTQCFEIVSYYLKVNLKCFLLLTVNTKKEVTSKGHVFTNQAWNSFEIQHFHVMFFSPSCFVLQGVKALSGLHLWESGPEPRLQDGNVHLLRGVLRCLPFLLCKHLCGSDHHHLPGTGG